MSEPITQPEGYIYTLLNPPETLEAAEERLWELAEKAEHISIQLEFADNQEYSSDEEFFIWKGKAVYALSHTRTEIRFLERWIGEQEFRESLAGLAAVKWSAPFHIGPTILRLTTEMRARYQPVYNQNTPPTDRTDAQRRRDELNTIFHRFQGYISGVKMLTDATNITGEGQARLMAPMTQILTAAQREATFLRRYLRAAAGEDMLLFCINLIDRAIETGLSLNEEETRFFRWIKEFKLRETVER